MATGSGAVYISGLQTVVVYVSRVGKMRQFRAKLGHARREPRVTAIGCRDVVSSMKLQSAADNLDRSIDILISKQLIASDTLNCYSERQAAHSSSVTVHP